MKNYYRVMLGQKSVYAKEALAGAFIGTDFGIRQDLSGDLPDSWRAFNEKFIPVFLAAHPEKSRIAAGLACGAIWTVSKGIRDGDIVLSPDGSGCYLVGEVMGDYSYEPAGPMPHRRPVRWLDQTVDRADMSDALRHSTGSIGTVSSVTGHAEELERLIGGIAAPTLVSTIPDVEDAAAFVMEAHLEDFLVQNWANTDLGKQSTSSRRTASGSGSST